MRGDNASVAWRGICNSPRYPRRRCVGSHLPAFVSQRQFPQRARDFPVAIIIRPCRPPRRVLNTVGEKSFSWRGLNAIANRMRYSPSSPSSPACFGTTEGFLVGFSRLSSLRYGREICRWRLMASPRCVSQREGQKRR